MTTIAELFTAEAKRTAQPLARIKTSAMLVDLHLSKLQITKTDKAASRQVADDHGSDVTRARVVKALLDPARMDEINKHDGETRAYHYDHTVGWGEGTARMIKAAAVDAYVDTMRQRKAERQRLVDAFVAGYEQFVIEDTRGLGTLVNMADYPSPQTIARKFGMSYELLPVPDGKHFEVLGVEDHIDTIKQQLEENTATALAGVNAQIIERIRKVVTHLADRLAALNDKEPGKNNVRFHGSTIENIAREADLIGDLNILDDPDIDALVADMKERLCAYGPEAIKDSPKVRQDVNQAANDILGTLAGMMPAAFE